MKHLTLGSRYAVLSDVNANYEALLAVLAEVKKENVEHILFLGNAVGYGPNPVECFDLLRQYATVYLRGRTEDALIIHNYESFSEPVSRMLDWTEKMMKTADMKESGEDRLEWLSDRSLIYQFDSTLAMHSTYLWNEEAFLLENMSSKKVQQVKDIHGEVDILLIGDNNHGWAYSDHEKVRATDNIDRLRLKKYDTYVISPGSVGQPRDNDPRACFVILSPEEIIWRRVAYDIQKTAKKIRENINLDNRWADRLIVGV